MVIVKLWNFFRGYVVIKIEGLSLEKFINYAINRGIYIWDIYRKDYTTMEAKVGLRGYKELRRIVRKSGCRIKISEKIGYPFFVHRMKARKMFMMGFIIAILAIFVTTSFVWNIEIVGNQSIPTEQIKEQLHILGLDEGVFKPKLDISNIKNKIMIHFENLAWIGIKIQGTKVIVEVVENVKPPKKISKDIPCEVIAKKKGVIEKVIARGGDALVKKGDIVKEGQVLITGVIKREEVPTRYVHAFGEVFAKTYYESNDEISLVKIRKVKTGNVFVKRKIKIGDNQIMLGIGDNPYQNVIIEKKNKSLSSWRNIKIPVEILIEEYYEVNEKEEKIDKKIAKKALKEKMTVNLVGKMSEDIKVLNQNIVYYEQGNRLGAKLTIEALEKIGQQREITPVKEEREDD